MKHPWQFAGVVTNSGDVIRDWLGRDPELQARMDVQLRRLRLMPLPWPMPYYRPLGDGVGEIRFDLRKVEHRLYGYFESRQFVVVLASSDKKAQKASIASAKKLKKQYDQKQPKVKGYDV